MKTNCEKIEYKNFKAAIHWSDEDQCFYCCIENPINDRDLVISEGATKEELVEDFHKAVDLYLECFGNL